MHQPHIPQQGVRASPQVPGGRLGRGPPPRCPRQSCVGTHRGSGRRGGPEQGTWVRAAHHPLLALPGKPPSSCPRVCPGVLSHPGLQGAPRVRVGGECLDCPRECLFLSSLFSPVCLQSRQCRETPSWSWRVGPWPLSPQGTASWKPVSPFPRSPVKMGPARARVLLSVCNTPVRGGVCFAG